MPAATSHTEYRGTVTCNLNTVQGRGQTITWTQYRGTVTYNLNTVQSRGQTVTWTQSRGQTVTWAVDNAACSVAGGMLAMLTTPS